MYDMHMTILSFYENWGVITFTLGLISFLIIFPIIFHFCVIPKIEKRLGKKLKYKELIYKWQVFARWFEPAVDISMFISISYLTWKTTGKKKIKCWERDMLNAHALAQTNYDIAEASWFEIFMSFLVMINLLNFCLLVLIHFIKLYV